MGMDKEAMAAMDELAKRVRQIDNRNQLPPEAKYVTDLKVKHESHKIEVYRLRTVIPTDILETLAYFRVVDDNGGVLKSVSMTTSDGRGRPLSQYQF